MPNHVTHLVKITGPAADVERFRQTAIKTTRETVKNWLSGEDEEREFTGLDFNAFVPMPDILRDSESSSAVDDGLAIMEFDARQKGEMFIRPPRGLSLNRPLEELLNWPWVKAAGITTAEGLRAELLKRSPDCIEKGRAALKAYEETGHADWYSWSCDNWGTKWNAYGYEEVSSSANGYFEFRFETAWSPPEPIFAKWAEMFPTLEIAIAGFDEGWGFAYDATLVEGKVLGGTCEATDDLYELVYGHSPERDEDEEEVPGVLS